MLTNEFRRIGVALLFAAAWLAFALDGVDPRRARARWGLAGAVFLAYAIEELFGFQHWLEGAWEPHIAAYLLLVVLTATAWAGGPRSSSADSSFAGWRKCSTRPRIGRPGAAAGTGWPRTCGLSRA